MTRARFRIAGVAVLAIATLVAGYFWLEGSSGNEGRQNGTNRSDAITESETSLLTDRHDLPVQAKKEFSLETSSLRGTEVDGGIALAADGRVVPDPGMRRLFDYYLSLVGEQDVVQIRGLLKDHVANKYGNADSGLILQYFDRYTDYLGALSSLDIGAVANPETRLEKVRALRKKMLGQEMASAFFSDEEALAELTLKRMAIANDANSTAEEKASLLAELDALENYSARTEADTAALVSEQTRQLDASKLTEAQRAAEREALWGKEAAGRLAQLDRQRAEWDERISQYLLARSRIDANRSLSANARAQAIAALRARQFNATEQRRIASLEAIGELKPGG